MRDIGVGIVFEKENINTLTSTSEVFLTIAATIAENDLQVDSERMRWSIRHRVENGWFSTGTGVFGYRMTKDNELIIVPEEAEIVKEIYARCIAGEGCVSIARALNARNIKTIWGYEWKSQGINSLIKNEKYKGDAMMGKQIIVNGRQKRNRGGMYGKQYYIENTHEPIVSREIWQQAQDAIESRKPKKEMPKELPVYPFTSIIYCAKCGTHYRHKINSSGTKWAAPIWTCGRRLMHKKEACDNPSIKDSVLREKFIECYNEFVRKRPEGESVITLQELVDRETRDLDELAKLYMQHLIPEAEYRSECAKSKATIEELRNKISEQRSKLVTSDDFVPITEFDEEKVKKFITKVIVEDYTVSFVFYNGVTYTRTYTNGKPGNKPGWNKED